MQMNDCVGKPLAIGDEVVFTEYNRHGMSVGKIIGFSKGLQMATVEYIDGGSVKKTKKTSGYLVRVQL